MNLISKWIMEADSETTGRELNQGAKALISPSEGIDLESSGRDNREFPWKSWAR